ncbi:unnamed protein product [Peronospora destructor]|uniref:Uncharacterized protein n=1 Tax=Peronospora destructor TaxID=86335 RepID=A0AAV0T7V8_9STRA|nr:unnamed protein product [Peronospora destructor]
MVTSRRVRECFRSICPEMTMYVGLLEPLQLTLQFVNTRQEASALHSPRPAAQHFQCLRRFLEPLSPV